MGICGSSDIESRTSKVSTPLIVSTAGALKAGVRPSSQPPGGVLRQVFQQK